MALCPFGGGVCHARGEAALLAAPGQSSASPAATASVIGNVDDIDFIRPMCPLPRAPILSAVLPILARNQPAAIAEVTTCACHAKRREIKSRRRPSFLRVNAAARPLGARAVPVGSAFFCLPSTRRYRESARPASRSRRQASLTVSSVALRRPRDRCGSTSRPCYHAIISRILALLSWQFFRHTSARRENQAELARNSRRVREDNSRCSRRSAYRPGRRPQRIISIFANDVI